jgi:hypothetical protein
VAKLCYISFCGLPTMGGLKPLGEIIKFMTLIFRSVSKQLKFLRYSYEYQVKVPFFQITVILESGLPISKLSDNSKIKFFVVVVCETNVGR